MKRIYAIVGVVAVLASTMFISCAGEKEIETVIAPPRNRTATYAVNSEGVYAWSYSSADTYSKANFWRGLWRHKQDAANIVRYTITPNVEWNARIVGDAAEYINFRVGKDGYEGFVEENFELKDAVSGNRGSNTLQIAVLKTPEVGEETKVCQIEIVMGGEVTIFGTFNLGAQQ